MLPAALSLLCHDMMPWLSVFDLLFLVLEKRVCDFFAAVDGGDDDEKGAAGHDEAELAIANVALVV